MYTLSYWIAAVIVLATIFIVFRLFVRNDYLKRGKLGFWAALSQWILILMWWFFSYYYMSIDGFGIEVSKVQEIIAWILIIPGASFFIFSFFWLGIGPSHGVNAQRLNITGPYRISRNPQCLGFIPAMVGFVLLWPTWHMFVSFILALVLSHTMILTEEEFLLNKFGDVYREYCKKTSRYL